MYFLSIRLVARGIIEGSKRPFSPTSLTPRNKSIIKNIILKIRVKNQFYFKKN